MAINLGALKALFSKLKPAARAIAPVTDDAARLVANYGDDVARGVANYGDDALAVADKVDDFLPTDGTWERLPGRDLKFVPRKLPKNISDYPSPDDSFPRTTSVLGDVVLGEQGMLQPHYMFNQKLDKPLDTSGMVIQNPELLRGLDYQDVDRFAFGIRPHRNTALGRWFAKNNPNYGFDIEERFPQIPFTRYSEPIGPQSKYVRIPPEWEDIALDDELFF